MTATHLRPPELALLDYATDDARDTVTLADKETAILQLYHQLQDQRLEKALLEQGTTIRSSKNLPPFLLITTSRTTISLRRQCRGAARHRRARAPRGAIDLHGQEESRADHSHDRSHPQSGASEGIDSC